MATTGLLAAACGGGGGGTTAAGTPGASGAAGTPKTGGTLTFAEFTSPRGLDPIVETGAGVTGLIEATAVYDTLLRYNYDTGSYDPGTALSATPNDVATVWTIKLRPGVTFSDGTPYDAAAVAFGISRFRGGTPDSPPCSEFIACPAPASITLGSYISDVTAVDPTTVRVTLTQPWGGFPAILAAEPGLIPSPTALKKDCPPDKPVNQCSFNTAPVGAGPFMVTSFNAGDSIRMVRNPNYWGGQVYLDGLEFVNLRDAGGQTSLQALQAGQVQMAFLRDPVAVAAAHDAKLPGFSNLQYAGQLLEMNVGSPTAATHNLKVRQAVAAAVDPHVVNERAYQGKAIATNQLLPKSFRWYPGVPGPTVNLDTAKKLVVEAKAEGWDGHIRLDVTNTPTSVNQGLAIQAQLQNAGMNVALDSTHDVAAMQGLVTKRDFELTVGGLNIENSDWASLAPIPRLSSTSSSNVFGLKDPTLDNDFKTLLAARTDDQKKAAWGAVEKEINAQLPWVQLAVTEEFIAWTPKVHGVVPGERTSVNLGKAWIG